ncbi:MAG TPA: polymer-forming cytoskeletal protein [Steroidobacteraceae bacterium]|nr:polymer-forming cytoskeletal protein [Steroidobacteraceae bacterium]
MGNPYDTASERMSVLPRSLKFKGELSAEEDLLIQGSIEGTIHHTQRVTVCEEGKVKADIRAQVIKVEGAVEGDLHAERSVFVAESGNLRGNIHAPSVCLVEGAHFNGAIDMESKKGAQQSSRSDGKAARAAANSRGQ